MALATYQGGWPDGFAEAEAKDHGRLMAACLTLLALAGDRAEGHTPRARRFVDRCGLDEREVPATARNLR